MFLNCVFIAGQLIIGKSVGERKDNMSNICARIMNPDIRAVDDSLCVGSKNFLISFLETVDEFRP